MNKTGFRIRQDVTPIVYDFYVDAKGHLADSNKLFARTAKVMMVLLERKTRTPTKAQLTAINGLKVENPGWGVEVFFRDASEMGATHL